MLSVMGQQNQQHQHQWCKSQKLSHHQHYPVEKVYRGWKQISLSQNIRTVTRNKATAKTALLTTANIQPLEKQIDERTLQPQPENNSVDIHHHNGQQPKQHKGHLLLIPGIDHPHVLRGLNALCRGFEALFNVCYMPNSLLHTQSLAAHSNCSFLLQE